MNVKREMINELKLLKTWLVFSTNLYWMMNLLLPKQMNSYQKEKTSMIINFAKSSVIIDFIDYSILKLRTN